MRLFHPESKSEREARDRLLGDALREPGTPFPIAAEYPLVLGDRSARASYCLADGEQLVAHANLWPRRLVDQKTGRAVKIGLVGNVATDRARRGQGLMRRLIEELKTEAVKDGMEALVLWSDLLEFYQKLGFASYGSEHRYVYLAADVEPGTRWRREPRPTEALLARLLERRLAVSATLLRTAAEFKELLTIPKTDLWVLEGERGYAVMGKGADMVGVVHEWGAPTAPEILAGLSAAARLRGLSHAMLLAPSSLPQDWQDALASASVGHEEHPMALVWTPEGKDAAKDALARGFVWGLDSI